ncbi:putative Sua5/YciO/YrdC/YwlC RNA-binding family protein [Candidatus Glomeribacter gigasporarum BEG34]|uniref:Threonylcarbamoyl-AMP synthase n=1 Tax=Candidatus Glomeribacter gigasporarum BEG34 TaxID=1070319 RepID=G2J8X4_9BURK|nr:putative Sua5/YciO/YrdC/YwlC RNA-binding family protein [Candidatus Glomeribacter gigasporarum BEG34]
MTVEHCANGNEIQRAAAFLDAGQLLAFPTETVYGLGADAQNPSAIARVYALKGRPATHPLIVHLGFNADPAYWIHGAMPRAARVLIDAFWPGPLTLILPRAAHIPAAVSGGQPSIGLRCPAHPLAQALLNAFHHLGKIKGTPQRGIAAPSANRFGRVSPTAAQHVRDEFGDAVPVLDGGACAVGIESTIVDLSRGFPAVLRPGCICAAQIAEALGEMPRNESEAKDGAPRVSGMLRAHYAPRTPLFLRTQEEITRALDEARQHGERIAVLGRGNFAERLMQRAAQYSRVHIVMASSTPTAYARGLYQLLRQLDTLGCARILVEILPEAPAWTALNDRLSRAAVLEHVSVRLPLARARRQYGDRCRRSRSPSRSDGGDPAASSYGEREATQGKPLKHALVSAVSWTTD